MVSPIPDHAFFEQPQFECLLGDNLLQVLRLAPELLDLIGRRGPRRVAGEPALAGLQELLRPRVIHALGDGAPHYSDDTTYRKLFSGKYENRIITGGIGHNLPQEAPQAFAQAIVDVDGS